MEDKKLEKKIISATKWSTITQIVSKLITPITNMILARILTPDAFGVIATITMIVSFTEMFTDSGFQKYLIQHEFKKNVDKFNTANVAFWTNFSLSIILWATIAIFSDQIAYIVGNPGLGHVIIVACIQLPLTSFSSIQMALYRRDFDFKTLFIVRIIGILIPVIITVPLALMGLGYWALIIGMISMHLFNAVYLTIRSPWKPKMFYDFKILKKMWSFSIWSLIESVSIWLTGWIDTFIIGYYLNQYYLGIYKTSTVMVNSLMSIVTASIIPVLFSALSRLQNDNLKFNNTYFKFQRIVAILVLPLGVGVYLYRNLATQIMLGSQWTEAANVIGVWALTSAIMIVFGHFASEAYRAKGKPKLSFVAQMAHLLFLVPIVIISAKFGFWALVYTRAFARIQFVIVHMIILALFIKISINTTIRNIFPVFFSVIFMFIFGTFMKSLSENIFWSLLSIGLCVLVYFTVLCTFPAIRKELKTSYKQFFS